MSAPDVTFKTFLTTVRDELAGQFPSAVCRVAIEPYEWSPYGKKYAYFIVPEDIVYKDAKQGATPTTRAFWVWYSCRIYCLRAITDPDFQAGVVGSASLAGAVEITEDAFEYLKGNFLSLQHIREAKVEWSQPSFFPASVEGSAYAACGSFKYSVMLRVVQSVEMQASPPLISSVCSVSVGRTSVRLGWTTNKPATSYIKIGTDPYPPNYSVTDPDTELVTEHDYTVSDLPENTRHYLKVWGNDENGNAGQSLCIYTFKTATVAGDDGEDVEQYEGS